ncbi:unnamed protein product [Cylindrotheca closterium]|uniref:Cyclin-dependent kinase 2 homolog n=1 Tax=Cylindrotheca closterium TaxID=2856 RepID=A0AAD2PVI9_9STRA|nr:unnamed protein product [Cylindrotheca closterium]
MIATQNKFHSINNTNNSKNNNDCWQAQKQTNEKEALVVSSSDDDDNDTDTDSSTVGSSHQKYHSAKSGRKKRPISGKEAETKPRKQARTTDPSSASYYQPKQTRDLKNCFRIRKHIGEGTFGSVFLTLDRETNKPKIIKRVKTRDDKSVPTYGFPYTALREIKLLKSIEHKNVIKLHEVVTTEGADGLPGQVFMVMEYMEYDLAGLLRMPILAKRLTKDHVQSWTRQLLQGCQHLHEQQIMHRDLKPANLLVDKQGTLKIGDFGLARKMSARQYTNSTIGTPWYRAPEILIGSANYSTKVDMWSTGCILFELASQKPLFHAKVAIELCQQIDKKCALIKEEPTWLPKEMTKNTRKLQRNQVLKHHIQLANLVSNLLKLDPESRLSAKDALKHEFLLDDNSNQQKKLNMNFPLSSCHELDVYKFRQQQKEQQQQQQRD